MPLIDLQTNLRSLKYGKDRPGGGSSKQPFIVKNIPGSVNNVPYSAATDNSESEGNSPDFILRNGILNIQDSAQDVKRITEWFATPIGLAFIAKQNLLERQNVPMPGRISIDSLLSGGGVLNRIYLPTSTIAQAGVLSLGYHLNKKGLNPFTPGYAVEGESAEGYFKTTLTEDNGPDDNFSRLTLLYKTNISVPDSIFYGGMSSEEITKAKQLYNINLTDPDTLFTYNGGPNSPIPGLGKTNIRFAGSGRRNRVNNNRTVGDAKLVTTDQTSQVYPIKKSTVLEFLNASYNTGINEFNREKTYGTSATNWDIANTTIDSQNVLEPTNTEDQQDKDSDLIKFFFERVDPTSAAADSSTFLFFRAYVNSITDNFKADWTPYKYVGRAENFYKYGGFGRDVQLSFTIYSHTEQEMIPLYNKLNRLLGTTAPTYSDAGLMLGNFVRITIGDYFNNMPSIINSINLTPSFEAGWEINRKYNGTIIKPEDGAIGQIPKMIEVSLGFTPLHNFTPKYGEDFIRTLDASTPATADVASTNDSASPSNSTPILPADDTSQFDIPTSPSSGPSVNVAPLPNTPPPPSNTVPGPTSENNVAYNNRIEGKSSVTGEWVIRTSDGKEIGRNMDQYIARTQARKALNLE